MVAVAGFAEDFVEEVGGAVDDEVLFDEVGGGVDAAEDLDDLEAVEGAVGVPDGVKDLGGALAGGFVAVLGGEPRAELSFERADVTGAHQLVAGADAEVQVTGRLFFKGEAEILGDFLGIHSEMRIPGSIASGMGYDGDMSGLRIAFLTLASAAFCFAADIDGKWKGAVQTDNGAMALTLDLKSDGENLTGTMTSQIGESPIKEGRIKGDEVSWMIVMERNGNELRIRNKAKLSGKELKVTVSVEGRDIVMEYTAKKAE